MNFHRTQQTAYVGKFSIRDIHTKKLIQGGGVVAPRPRLYDNAGQAEMAARSIRWADVEAVQLYDAIKLENRVEPVRHPSQVTILEQLERLANLVRSMPPDAQLSSEPLRIFFRDSAAFRKHFKGQVGESRNVDNMVVTTVRVDGFRVSTTEPKAPPEKVTL